MVEINNQTGVPRYAGGREELDNGRQKPKSWL